MLKRDIGRKSRFCHTPCIRRSRWGSPSEYCHAVWCEETRVVFIRCTTFDDV